MDKLEMPRIIISKNHGEAVVYFSIAGHEYQLDPDTAKLVGETLFKTGCDVEVQS